MATPAVVEVVASDPLVDPEVEEPELPVVCEPEEEVLPPLVVELEESPL
jgi:hypothetical protein